MHTPDIHTIDEYLLGRLKGEALSAFEQKLGQDNAFAMEVMERKQLMQQVEAYGELRLKRRIRKAIGQEERPASRPRIKPWQWALVALLLALLGLAIWRLALPERPEQLYAAFYEPYPLSFGRRGDELGKPLADAGEFYNNGNYKQALPIFETVLTEQQEKQDGLILAIGICQLELGQSGKAKESFFKIMQNQGSPYRSQAEWYIALSALQAGELAKCREMLQQIAKSNNANYAAKAGELLSKLGD